VVKIVGETFCKTYWQQHGLDTTALRFFNVYGPRQDGSGYGFVVSIFVRQAIEGKDLTVFNGGQMTRSFIYIDDNIEASLRVIDNKQSSGECINVGSGNFIKIIDLARKVIDISGNNHLRARLVKSNRDGEIKNRRPSLKKMHKILKYRSAYDLDSGLLNTYNHFSKVVPTDSCASVKAR
jgi:UDP-glucose 4-epimerase